MPTRYVVKPVSKSLEVTSKVVTNRFRLDCVNRGKSDRSLRKGCGSCKVYACSIHGDCVVFKKDHDWAVNQASKLTLPMVIPVACETCNDYIPKPKVEVDRSKILNSVPTPTKITVNPIPKQIPQHHNGNGSSIKWAYGVTTVPERINHHLPKTLNSLTDAGFGNPRLFVDGGTEEQYRHFGLKVTTRNPKVRAYANWYMSLLELFMRNPDAQRFAIFQDDIKCVRNLRPYLDQLLFPQKGYINLTTFWESESIVGEHNPIGIAPAAPQRLNNGQPKKPNALGVIPQHGRGALGLVFDREGVLTLLRHPHMTNRVMPDKQGHIPDRAYRMIDGAVIEAMNNAGYTEYVHNPSLVQHAGTTSTITGRKWGAKAISKSFPGEQFDCLSLLATEQPVSV